MVSTRARSKFTVGAWLTGLAVAGLVGAGCGSSAPASANTGHQPTTTKPATPTTTSVPSGTHLASAKIAGSAAGKHAYRISCAYPVLSETPQSGAATFNSAVSAIVKPYVAQFKSFVAKDNPPIKTGPSTLHCVWTKAVLTEDTVSVVISGEEFPTGAAHPFAEIWTDNYDLPTSRVYSLGDLFQPGSDYLKVLSQDSRTALAKLFKGESGWAPPTPLASNFAAWSLTPSGFEVTFQDYEVGPYFMGTPTIKLPYSELAKIANTSGPLEHV